MKVFLVHRYKEFNKDKEIILETIKFFNPRINIAYLKEEKFCWQRKAKKKIKESSLILNLENNKPSKNVKWELKIAHKYEKRIFTVNMEKEKNFLNLYKSLIDFFKKKGVSNIYDDSISHNIEIDDVIKIFKENGIKENIDRTKLEHKDIIKDIQRLLEQVTDFITTVHTYGYPIMDKYTEEEKRIDHDTSLFNIQYRILEKAKRSDFDLFNIDLEKLEEEEKAKILLQQYEIFVQSSESLMERRQTVNNFYLTINSGLLAVSAALFTFKLSVIVTSFIIMVICLLGSFSSRAWSNMLASYGVLNTSKIKVISLIEKHLPVSLYDAEWNVMNSELNDGSYKSFTKTETTTAKNFFYFYIGIAIIFGLIFLVNVIRQYEILSYVRSFLGLL